MGLPSSMSGPLEVCRLYGLQWSMRSMSKQASTVSYSLSGTGHPPHRSGRVSVADFDLVSWSSLWIFLRLCCVLCLCMSLARYSSNNGFVLLCLYMS